MDIDIRKSILDNFKNTTVEDLRNSIEESIKDNEEITLPGLGVMFEILWNNIDNDLKNKILTIINDKIK